MVNLLLVAISSEYFLFIRSISQVSNDNYLRPNICIIRILVSKLRIKDIDLKRNRLTVMGGKAIRIGLPYYLKASSLIWMLISSCCGHCT